MKKKLFIINIFIVVFVIGFYVYHNYMVNKTVANVALDSTNTVVTCIWDSDHIEKYHYLVIPDATTKVLSDSGSEYEYAKVTDIGKGAFQGNIWIKSVYIPTNIKHIQKNAFNGCNSVESVSYAGTEKQWKEIIIDMGNDVLKQVPIEYNARMPRTNDY